jgi:isopentenyl-diphosphate delta-isomerase
MNSDHEILIHKRASHKYHSGGLWTNTCCSHPKPGENTSDAAIRRLAEEMGLTAELEFLFSFKYFAKFQNGLKEHEIDHVFIGYTDDLPKINKEEAEDFAYVSLRDLKQDIALNPEKYTILFKIILEKMAEANFFSEK